MIISQPKKGHLLISEPSIMGDLSFNRSVILLSDHTAEGSIGFILNKPLEYKLKDLVPESNSDFQVYNGGPVEQDNLYFIHKVPEMIPGSIEISLGIYWGGDFDTVLELMQSNKIDQSQILFFLGYSGWEPNQLVDELENNSWVISENKYQHELISKCSDSFWKENMLNLGGEYSIWSNAPEDPTFN
ncbi:MAG: transcriptional regulator [Bacteroidetes bacterium MedPE-SWsnd-G2]|nr:MAG: transcriptional regulator [Bacteroidetes bacterium MedPE-SWsnd-G2]